MSVKLNLRPGDEDRTVEDFSVGDLVTLHSDTLDCELIVRVIHPERGNLGGNLAESPSTPHLEEGDHVHFEPGQALSVE